jgi:hypothetical protein
VREGRAGGAGQQLTITSDADGYLSGTRRELCIFSTVAGLTAAAAAAAAAAATAQG